MNGSLRVKVPKLAKFVGTACKIDSFVFKTASCRFSIVDSFATYDATLSYGKPVSQIFRLKVIAEEYNHGGWKNPADISVYMHPEGPSGETRLKASSILVTEYMVKIKTSPDFNNFKVFKSNKTIISKVWDDFWDYVFRRCKQDMRKVMKDSYARWLAKNAAHTKPINDSLFWN